MAEITIADVRQKYPQYGDMTDEQLAKALHNKYYSDMPYESFAKKIGLKGGTSITGVAAEGAKGFVRGASQTAEMIPEGISKLLPPNLRGPFMEAVRYLAAPSRSLVRANPENTAEQMASTGGEIAGASVAGGGAAGGVRGVLTNVIAPAVGGAVGEQVAGTPGRVIGSLAPTAVQLAAPALKAAVRGAIRGADVTKSAERLKTLDEAGVRPTLEDIAPNRAFLEKTMSKAPGAQQLQNRAIEGQADDLKASVEKLIPEASASPTSAGQAVKEGLSQWKDRFLETWKRLDAKTSQLLGNSPVNASKTQEVLGKLSQKIDDPELNALFRNPKIASLQDVISRKNGIVDVNTLIQLRREIGEQAASSFSQLKSDLSSGELKAIYGALSEDIKRAAATSPNGPAVLAALEKQNAYYKAGSDRIRAYYGRLSKQADPDKVFSMIDSQSKQGSVGVRTVMKALPKDARDEVISAVLQRMGKAKASVQGASGEVFSPETLLTNWNKYTPEAKRALFGGSSNPDLLTQMDKLAKAAGILRESNKVLGNPSGTGAVLTNFGTLGALVFKPIETMTIIGSSAAGVYLMTKPEFLRWAVQATQVDGNAMAGHISRLAAIANSSKDQKFKDAVGQYADALEKTQ